MTDQRVEKRASVRLGAVDGNLMVGSRARISAASGRQVTVTGRAHFDGDADLDCDFQCDSLDVGRGALRVGGDLTVAKEMDVAHTLKTTGTVRAAEIGVGGRLAAGAVSCGGHVTVGGVVDVEKTFEAESLDVGGKVTVGGAVKLKDLGVGGVAKIGGGSIAGRAQVGGVFESDAALEFGDLQVYGKCVLPAGSKGHKVAASGKLEVGGDLACEEVEVGGVAEVKGDCATRKVTVNGRLEVSGSLSASETLDNFGSGEVGGDFTGGALHLGGRFKARKAVLADTVEISGEIETTQGVKATSVVIGSGSKARGPIVGERVELSKSKLVLADWGANWAGQLVELKLVGRMTSVEDVYGGEVILGPNTRCRQIFARTVELGPGCVVEQVTYTQELRKGSHHIHETRPSNKVEKLPPFPV